LATVKTKYMKIILAVYLTCFTINICNGQNTSYNISPTYIKSIKKDVLNNAKAILDINPGFPTSWVKTYHEIKLTITHEHESTTKSTVSENLTPDQIAILAQADLYSDINLNIKYTPKNSEEIRNIDFTYTVTPDSEARFPDNQDLESYIKSSIINKLDTAFINNTEMVKVKFTVDKDGNIISPALDQPTKNKEADNILIDAIRNMPQWSPAKKSDGTYVKQDFEFTFGRMVGY
jgi:TonB family protein